MLAFVEQLNCLESLLENTVYMVTVGLDLGPTATDTCLLSATVFMQILGPRNRVGMTILGACLD